MYFYLSNLKHNSLAFLDCLLNNKGGQIYVVDCSVLLQLQIDTDAQNTNLVVRGRSR